jgi:surface antigen
LSAKSKEQAASAQFNALQFGRVGAPHNWVGDNGQTGAVTVGPYVRVNLIDCRDFTHTVTIAGQNFAKKGTACREADGSWTVSA